MAAVYHSLPRILTQCDLCSVCVRLYVGSVCACVSSCSSGGMGHIQSAFILQYVNGKL